MTATFAAFPFYFAFWLKILTPLFIPRSFSLNFYDASGCVTLCLLCSLIKGCHFSNLIVYCNLSNWSRIALHWHLLFHIIDYTEEEAKQQTAFPLLSHARVIVDWLCAHVWLRGELAVKKGMRSQKNPATCWSWMCCIGRIVGKRWIKLGMNQSRRSVKGPAFLSPCSVEKRSWL